MAIWDASYIFPSILVKANILAYFSFFENISPIKRLCPFNKAFIPHWLNYIYINTYLVSGLYSNPYQVFTLWTTL